MAAIKLHDALKDLALDKEEYISLLGKLIGESKHLQNNPRQGLVPQEQLAANHVLDILRPYTTENGGPLMVQEIVYKEGRPNIKITYPGTSEDGRATGFIGSHMDVVPANPETWNVSGSRQGIPPRHIPTLDEMSGRLPQQISTAM
jgi:acetylornithine deacetylase